MILLNRIRTPDGTVLTSRSRHDYKTYMDANGEVYMVDGGLQYLRRSVNNVSATELSLDSGDNIEDIREGFEWGTYGKDGKQPLKRVLLKNLTNEHIHAIIQTQTHLPDDMIDVFRRELCYRKANNCNISENK
jgi:hypothetical protein